LKIHWTDAEFALATRTFTAHLAADTGRGRKQRAAQAAMQALPANRRRPLSYSVVALLGGAKYDYAAYQARCKAKMAARSASPRLGVSASPVDMLLGQRVALIRDCWDRKAEMHLHAGTKGKVVALCSDGFVLVELTATLFLQLPADALQPLTKECLA